MNIPNDTGHPWRLNKFVEYQHEAPSIHYRTLGAYIVEHSLDEDDAVYLSWLMSVTYNEITCMLLFESLDWRTMKLSDVTAYWLKYKPVLDFGSARKYAKNMDWFVPLISSFMKLAHRHPYKWLKNLERETPTETYKNINKTILSIQFVGRFAADLFMEMIVHLSKLGVLDIEIEEPFQLDWKNCSNLTSGMFNIFYRDEDADRYDKTKVVTQEDMAYLNKKILVVQKAIKKAYPEQDADLPMFIGKICSFRNLFKSARYGGFHHDRQLGVLRAYEKALPKKCLLWEDVVELRRDLFPPHLLGEIGGWGGIRKERKKLWVTRGLTGVEAISQY